jgi:hypothetical protein
MTNPEIEIALQHLVGTRYVPSLKAYISELTGRPRIVGPNEITTYEFDVERIQIRADSTEIVTGFAFG